MRTRVFIFALLTAMLTADIAMAMGLGAAQLKSGLGQPLKVIIPVLGDGNEDVVSSCFAIAPASEADDGIPALNKVKLALKNMGGLPYLLLTTTSPVNDPVVLFTVEARCPGMVRRDYTLLLDVADSSNAKPEIATPSAVVISPVSRQPHVTGSASQSNLTDKPARNDTAQFSSRKTRLPHSQVNQTIPSPTPNLALRMSADLTWLPGQHPLSEEQKTTLKRMQGKLSINSGGQSSEVDRLRDDMVATQQQLAQARQELALLKEQMARTEVPAVMAAPVASSPVVKPVSHWWQSGWLWGALALLVLVIGYFIDRRRKVQNFSFTPAYDEEKDSEADLTLVSPIQRNSEAVDVAAAFDKDDLASVEQPLDLEFTVTSLPGHELQAIKSGRNELLQTEALSVSNLLRVTEEAEVFLGLGYVDRAIAVLTEDIAAKPRNHPAVWFMLLGIYRQQGDHDAFAQAVTEFQLRFNLIPPTWELDTINCQDGEGILAIPHIQTKIMSLWPNHECHYYLSELLYDDRNGSRQGFSLDVYRDIIWLKEILDILSKPETMIAEEVAAGDNLDWNFNSPVNGQ